MRFRARRDAPGVASPYYDDASAAAANPFNTRPPHFEDFAKRFEPTAATSGGANLGRAAPTTPGRLVPPGGAAEIPVRGALRLAGRELTWAGGDGLSVSWLVDPARGGYRLRLRYHAPRPATGDLAGRGGSPRQSGWRSETADALRAPGGA